MQDPFTGKPTCIRGRSLPGRAERAALQHDHERRLAALAGLGAAAAQCGIRADTDRDLVVLPEDEVILLEAAGGAWSALSAAIRLWRRLLSLRPLSDFGFSAVAENPLEEPNPRLHRIGGGVEAWAFASVEDASVYKFYLPREEKRIGSAFGFGRGEEAALLAEAQLGDYRALLEKLLLIQALGGMATELVAVTPEGILIAKQTLGDTLGQGEDMSVRLPEGLIEIPSRFLRANRDHPRLFFLGERSFLVADLHARNFVRGQDGALRVIDLVAAPWPEKAEDAAVGEWLARVRADPTATALPGAPDGEL
jgi:predicted DCC family thiol-disulfide oxidoreductase YuxK